MVPTGRRLVPATEGDVVIDWMLGASRRDGVDDFNSTVKVWRDDSADVTWNGTDYVAGVTVLYEGAARVRSQNTSAVAVQAGDRPFTLRTYDVQVPHDAAVTVDDHVDVVTSRDPLAVGLALRVIDVPKTEWVSVRNLVAVEET